jgi:TatD DNase family protein
VAVTATARDFAGVYRGKQYHPPDFESTLDRALSAGVEKVVLTGMSLSDIEHNADIARSRPGQCSITIGVHPYHATEVEQGGEAYLGDLLDQVRRLSEAGPGQDRLVSAFGELGLDYDRLQHAPKEAQIHAFKAQLDAFVSEKFDLPLFLHCRAAFDDFVDIIGPYVPRLPRGGLVHSFVGSSDQMKRLVELGFHISVNGFSFADVESLQMVADIPLSHLQIETDAPWGYLGDGNALVKKYCANASPLHASKKRDKWDAQYMVKERNEWCAMERVAFIVAGLKGITVEEVTDAAWENSVTMFGLSS